VTGDVRFAAARLGPLRSVPASSHPGTLDAREAQSRPRRLGSSAMRHRAWRDRRSRTRRFHARLSARRSCSIRRDPLEREAATRRSGPSAAAAKRTSPVTQGLSGLTRRSPGPTSRDAFAAVETGEAALSHDPDRELGRRPRRRHSSPDADVGASHRGPNGPADPASAHGNPRKPSLDDIRSVESHVMALGSAATSSASSGWKTIVAADTAGSARRFPPSGAEQNPRRHRFEPRGRESTASSSRREHRGRGAQHHGFIVLAARVAMPRADDGNRSITTFPIRVAQRAGRALQGARAASPPTASDDDQARELHDRGQFFHDAILWPDVEGHPEQPLAPRSHSRSWRSSSKELKILGVYPAHPVPPTFRGSRM